MNCHVVVGCGAGYWAVCGIGDVHFCIDFTYDNICHKWNVYGNAHSQMQYHDGRNSIFHVHSTFSTSGMWNKHRDLLLHMYWVLLEDWWRPTGWWTCNCIAKSCKVWNVHSVCVWDVASWRHFIHPGMMGAGTLTPWLRGCTLIFKMISYWLQIFKMASLTETQRLFY